MIMAMWGRFAFGINNAAFQELRRSKSWSWPSQERFGQSPILQYTGEGDETLVLPGVIYPEWRGGLGQINEMRDIANEATPQALIDGRGNILGLWVATDISEVQTIFGGFGIPRKQEFTLSLKYFPSPEVTGNLGVNALTKLGKKLGIDVKAIMDMVKKIQSAAGQLKAAIEQAQMIAQSVQATIGAPFAEINKAAQFAKNTANDFKQLAQNAENILAMPATTAANAVASANAAVTTIVEATPTLTSAAAASARSLKTSLNTVIDASVAPAGVIATRACMVSANRLTSNISNTFRTARGSYIK